MLTSTAFNSEVGPGSFRAYASHWCSNYVFNNKQTFFSWSTHMASETGRELDLRLKEEEVKAVRQGSRQGPVGLYIRRGAGTRFTQRHPSLQLFT